MKAHRPNIYETCERALIGVSPALDFIGVDGELFEACYDNSIDHVVIERTKVALVGPLDAGKNDIGLLPSLWSVDEKDDAGDSVTYDAIVVDSTNSQFRADDRPIAVCELHGVVVVSKKDATIVARKDRVQDAKLLCLNCKLPIALNESCAVRFIDPGASMTRLTVARATMSKELLLSPGQG